jgi:hypothetical protein
MNRLSNFFSILGEVHRGEYKEIAEFNHCLERIYRFLCCSCAC